MNRRPTPSSEIINSSCRIWTQRCVPIAPLGRIHVLAWARELHAFSVQYIDIGMNHKYVLGWIPSLLSNGSLGSDPLTLLHRRVINRLAQSGVEASA